MDAGELASRHGQVARRPRAAREHDRIELSLQIRGRHRRADGGVGLEHHAVLFHQPQPPVEELFLHLELGDAVAQEAADPVGALEHRYPVTGTIELLGGGEAGRP